MLYEGVKCKSMIVPDWENQTMGVWEQGKQEIKSSVMFPSTQAHTVPAK